MQGENLVDERVRTVIEARDVTFIVIPTVTTLLGKHMRLTDKKSKKLQYNALIVRTKLQTLKLTWVNESSKRQHDLIVESVLAGEINSMSELNERISGYVTYYGFAPVHLIPAKVEWYE